MTDQTEDGGGWGALSELPGNPLMWVLILSELAVFGAFFGAFAISRMLDPVLFLADQATLDRLAGGINTMLLLTSGLFAALAVAARGREDIARCRLWLGAAALLGVGFLAVKFNEYADKAAQGYGLETDTFFTLFYLITGFHAAHVVLGLVILGIVAWKPSLDNVETGAAFWHMVDLIWVLVYPIIYLIR